MSSDDNVRAIMILDVIGKPEKHLTDSLEELIKEIDKEKGVKVLMKDIKVPTLMKDQKDFFTTFAEVEVEVEDVLNLAVLLFKYMPAHLEIISPEVIAISNNGWNDILNELARRLHAYDEVARVLQNDRLMLLKKIEELGGNVDDLFGKQKVEEPKEKQEKVGNKKKN